jgi:hypothetical protein
MAWSKLSNLSSISYTTAIALAAFSGGVATFGMMRLVPGAEIVVGAMGILFETGKLTCLAMLHRSDVPRIVRAVLACIGIILMTVNVAGVSGFLSNAFEHQRIGARAINHTAEEIAHSTIALIERQLTHAETNLGAAQAALVKARDDKARVKAAQAIVTTATADRDALVKRLATAQATKAKAEGDTITAGSEFAAIAFIAGTTGASIDRVAHIAITTISTVPEILIAFLVVAAGYTATKPTPIKSPAPRRRKPTSKKRTPRRPRELKLVNVTP